MVLRFQGIPEIAESELAVALGLHVPPNKAIDYPFAAISSEPKDWGVRIGGHHSETLAAFLREKRIPIQMQYVPVNNIARTSFAEWLEENLNLGVSLIVGFDYRAVFLDGANVGHMSIVESIPDRTGSIILIEPEAGLRLTTDELTLYRGMQTQGGGTWLFSTSADKIVTESI